MDEPFFDDDALSPPRRRRGGRGRGRGRDSTLPDPEPLSELPPPLPPVRRAWLSPPLVALAVFLVVAWLARRVVVLLVIAVLFAHALTPVVSALARIRVRGRRVVSRGAAAVVVLLAALAGIGLIVSALIPVLAADLSQMVAKVPDYVHVIQDALARARVSQTGLALPAAWWGSLDGAISAEMTKLAGALGQVTMAFVSHALRVLGLVIIPILSFHLLRDGSRFTAWILSLVPARRRLMARGLSLDVDRALAAYVRGQSIVCLVMGTVVSIALTVIKFPYPPLLGTLAGLAEAIPYVGALIVTVTLVVVGLSLSTTYAVLGVGVYLVVNQILGVTVGPRVMGSRLAVHPIAVILAVLAGAEVAGFPGMLLALPTVAVANVLLERWRGAADAER